MTALFAGVRLPRVVHAPHAVDADFGTTTGAACAPGTSGGMQSVSSRRIRSGAGFGPAAEWMIVVTRMVRPSSVAAARHSPATQELFPGADESTRVSVAFEPQLLRQQGARPGLAFGDAFLERHVESRDERQPGPSKQPGADHVRRPMRAQVYPREADVDY